MSGYRAGMTDAAFAAWAEREKPCRYCNTKFIGPICPRCELPLIAGKKSQS